jgi:uncharacterized protein with ParB-like and HNH nuclease domain
LKASETNLQTIIEGTRQYSIPMFQRTYSWKEKQWNQLWEDLVDLFENNYPNGHFIGSIVSIPMHSGPHGVQQFLVIDGQQRLTTLLLLLAAIRDLAIEQDLNRLADEIELTLLVNNFKSGEDYYKLIPTQVDKQHFMRIINKERIDGPSESLIVQCFRHFKGLIEKDKFNLEQIKNIITNSLTIVSIVLSHDDNPYLVFESLNAKGQPLTQADLIRNYLFMRIPQNKQEDAYLKYWLPMQERLGDELTEFIRHYLIGRGLNVRKNDVYSVLRNLIGSEDAEKYLIELSDFSIYYACLLDPSLESDIDIQKGIKRINEFEAKTAYPFFLYIYYEFKSGRYKKNHFVQILNLVENYLVRRFICNIPSKQLNKTFLSLYSQVRVFDPELAIEEIKTYLQNREYPKNDEFIRDLKERNLYGQGEKRKRALFILKSLENYYEHKEKVDLENTTIEHIMPQTLTDAWRSELGDDAEIIQELYLHTLGNLTLTAYNAELSNEPFDTKKKYYSKSNIELNKELLKYTSFSRENIEQRADELAQLCLKVWGYFGNEQNEVKKVTGTSPRLLYILGKKETVKTWREVLEKTLIEVYHFNPDKYELIHKKFPRFVSKTGENMRKARPLPNGDYFETNLSANSINRFCKQMIEEIGLQSDDWNVEITL